MNRQPTLARFALFALLALLNPAALAAAQSAIPVRQVIVTAAINSLRDITGVRALSGGRVLVTDAKARRIVILDSAMTQVTLVADSAGTTRNKFVGSGRIFPYLGDSTVLVDEPSQALVVIAADGRFMHSMAVPQTSDLFYIGNAAFGTPGFDSRGRIIYRGRRPAPNAKPPVLDGKERTTITNGPDSAPILRGDFETRSVDTITMMRIALPKFVYVSNGRAYMGSQAINPLPSTDEWALLPDGTIAIVRGIDYHVDWIHADGTMESSPKMPFDWKRITFEEKQQLVDSLKAQYDRVMAKLPPPPPQRAGEFPSLRMPFVAWDPGELPDYRPPVVQGQFKADAEGRLWILPSTSVLFGKSLVFDVVDRGGRITQRVKLPEDRTLVGFGAGGVVYLAHGVGDGMVALERGRVQ